MSEIDLLARIVLGLLAFAILFLGLLSVLPATAAKARGLWPLMLSEVVIVAGALALVLPGGPWTTAALALLALRCAWEAAVVVVGRGGYAPSLVAGLAGLAAGLAHAAGGPGPAAGVVLVVIAAAIAGRHAPSERRREGWLLLAFPLLPLVGFAYVAGRPGGAATLLAAFVLVETMDSLAVLGGRLFGRRPAFPRLSPRKTVEGLAVGLAGVTAVAFGLGVGLLGRSPGEIVVVTVVAATATVAGDLLASRIKRRAGVKDYPPIHPIQGGVLDIVDAWLVTGTALGLIAALA